MGPIAWLMVIAWSFMCPGAGQAIAERPRAAFVWAAAGLVAVLVVPLTVWAVFVAVAVRLGAAIDAIVRLRRARLSRPTWWSRPAAVATGAWLIGVVYASLFVHAFKIPSTAMSPTLAIDDHIYVEGLTLQWRSPERGEVIVFRQPCQPDRDYNMRVIAVANDTIEIRCNVVYVNGAAVPSELIAAECEYYDRDDFRGDWFSRTCSRYRETLDGRTYEVFHDPERPQRDEARRVGGGLGIGDAKDFPELGGELRNCGTVDRFEGGPQADQQPGRIVETKPEAGPCEPQYHFVVPPDSLFVLGDNRNNSNDSRFWGVVPVGHVKGRVVGRWWPLGRIGAVK
jgi:signal peptidase I